MPFLPPNQQRESTEGICNQCPKKQLPRAFGTKMLAGMLADLGSTLNRLPGAAAEGLLAPPRTSTYCPRAPAYNRMTENLLIYILNVINRKAYW